MDLDRQSIEKRDFPIARRGYDPVAVDAHLRALAVEVQELLDRPAERAGEATLGSAAASQVQGILEAAERTAAEIHSSATEDAARMRAEATADAQRTRDDAVQRAQVHVAAVAHATAALLVRVESMDGEVGALVQSIQVAAGRLAADLGSVEGEMGQLYDAAAGRGDASGGVEQAGIAPAGIAPAGIAPAGPALAGPATPVSQSAEIAAQVVAPRAPVAPHAPAPEPVAPHAPAPSAISAAPTPPPAAVPTSAAPPVEAAPAIAVPAPPPATAATESGTARAEPSSGGGDLDGARLVALNMALNGESRERADRYLREHYEISDRAKLLDEVYAAIEV